MPRLRPFRPIRWYSRREWPALNPQSFDPTTYKFIPLDDRTQIVTRWRSSQKTTTT